MKKCAIVTGSGGLIGSEATRFLIGKGYRVLGIDNDMRAYFFGQNASTKSSQQQLKNDFGDDFMDYSIDIRNYERLEIAFKNYAASKEYELCLVVHTAAQPSHDWAANEPLTDFGINAVGTINLLELTRKYVPSATFIFTSTNKVYGDRPNYLAGLTELDSRWEVYDDAGRLYAIDETMSIDNCKHSVFGASKVAADIMVQEYGRYWKMNTACFRGGCLTGSQHKSEILHGFLSYLIKCIVHDKHYDIFGDGKQVRDNIHSSDLVQMFWLYHQQPSGCGVVYNAGGGRHNSTSILEAIASVNELRRADGLAAWNDYTILADKWRIGDHVWYISELAKFQADYPQWKISVPLTDIIKEIYETEMKVRNAAVEV